MSSTVPTVSFALDFDLAPAGADRARGERVEITVTRSPHLGGAPEVEVTASYGLIARGTWDPGGPSLRQRGVSGVRPLTNDRVSALAQRLQQARRQRPELDAAISSLRA